MKRILIAIMAIVLVAGLTGGAFAYFSDTETVTDQNFTAGILDIDDSGIGSADISEDIVVPGTQYENDISIGMEANSNMTAARTEFDVDADNWINGATEWSANTDSDSLAKYTGFIYVTKLTWGGENLLDAAADALGTYDVPLTAANIKVQMDADWNGDATMDSVKLSTLMSKVLFITDNAPTTLEFDWGIPAELAAVEDNALQGDNCDIDLNVAVAQTFSQAAILS